MTVIRHWTEADQLPKCQHCEAAAEEYSFMCADHAHEADTEVETLREQLAGAVDALREWVAASDGLKAVDTGDGQAIKAALARVDAAKAVARRIGGQ